MFNTCIVVADASRARFFVHERTSNTEGVTNQIQERLDLINPGRAGTEGHTADHDEKFAHLIAKDFAHLVGPARRVVVCASPRMLGSLRAAGIGHPRDGVEIHEIPHDLVKLSPTQLCEQLAGYGVLPAPHATVITA